jgi:hypothetical protein
MHLDTTDSVNDIPLFQQHFEKLKQQAENHLLEN